MFKTKVASAAFIGFAFVVFSGLEFQATAQTIEIKKIALTGESAPGTKGRTFRTLGTAPSLSASCQVALYATLDSSDTSNREGYWLGNSHDLKIVARTGDAAPGTGGLKFYSFPEAPPSINALDEFVFFGLLDPGTVDGVWAGDAKKLSLIARQGDEAPGTGGKYFSLFGGQPIINEEGKSIFFGIAGDTGIWIGDLKDLELIDQGSFTSLPALNSSGQIAVLKDRAVVVADSSSSTIVAGPGDLDPNTGRTFNFPGAPDLNSHGETAFKGNLTGATDNEGVWAGSRLENLKLIALEGQIDPVTGDEFLDFRGEALINDRSDVAFSGVLDGPIRSGIWLYHDDQLSLVALSGTPAPGTTNNFTVLELDAVLNASGELAFRTGLDGDPTMNFGIWAGPPGELKLIVRTGDLIEVSPGDFRPVQDLRFITTSGNADSKLRSFNNAGVVAFLAIFPDSMGLFVASAAPVDLIDELILLVENSDMDNGTKSALLDKLSTAERKISNDNERDDKAVARVMGDFNKVVEAHKGAKIDPAEADTLLASGDRIICILNS